MSDPASDKTPTTAEEPLSLRVAWRAHGTAVCVLAALTLAIVLGAYFALHASVGGRAAVLGCLALAVVWTAVAAPLAAAGAARPLGAVLRAGILADATGVALLVLWATSPYMSFSSAVQVYCIAAAMALAATAATRVARGPHGRYAAAVSAALVLMLMLSGPFWTGGALHAAGYERAGDLVAIVVRVNAFYSITGAVYHETHFSWNEGEANVMYSRIAQVQRYDPPAARWYDAVLTHLLLAGILVGVASVRGRRSRAAAQPDRSGPD